MSKKNIFFALLIVCLFSNNAFAAYVGGPLQTIGQGKWDFIVETNSAQDRDLAPLASTDLTSGFLEGREMLAGKIIYGILDGLDIYFKAAGADWKVDTKWSDGSRTKFEYSNEFLFGGGIKYIYL